MVHFVAAAHGFEEILLNGINIEGCVVGQNVDNDADIIFVGAVDETSHISF